MALIGWVEAAHRQELRVVWKEVQMFSSRLTVGETSLSTLDQRVSALETVQDKHTEAAAPLQLHLGDMEDRSRRNNLRLRGLPEATESGNLAGRVTDIFKGIEGVNLPEGASGARQNPQGIGP